MNRNMKTVIAAIGILFVVGCKESKKTEEVQAPEAKIEKQEEAKNNELAMASFMDEATESVWGNYLELKTALVNSNVNEAQAAADKLASSMADGNNTINEMATEISQATDIEKQRQLFSALGEQVEALLRENLSGGTIYKQFCPMAFNNEGGYWLSDAGEIRNPYFGDKMLKCGKVAEEISK